MKQICLEVMDGPMDGLICVSKNEKCTIYRDSDQKCIDNIMCLQFDNGISNPHAEIINKKGQWYLKDLGSQNGIPLEDRLLKKNENYLLEKNQLFCLESTLIKLLETDSHEYEYSSKSNNFFVDLRLQYKERMSDKLSNLWNQIYSESTNNNRFCDTRILFSYLLKNTNIQFSLKKYLPDWIQNIRKPFYFESDHFLIAPRIWRIMNIATQITANPVCIDHLIFSIFLENRSLLSELMKSDYSFITSFIVPFINDLTISLKEENDIFYNIFEDIENRMEYVVKLSDEKIHNNYKNIRSFQNSFSNHLCLDKTLKYLLDILTAYIEEYKESHFKALEDLKDQIIEEVKKSEPNSNKERSFKEKDLLKIINSVIEKLLKEKDRFQIVLHDNLQPKISDINKRFNKIL